jgi:uptake hydrogenase large subunit
MGAIPLAILMFWHGMKEYAGRRARDFGPNLRKGTSDARDGARDEDMMIPEAAIAVTLDRRGPGFAPPRLASTRQVGAAALFVGRSPAEVLTLLPAVFALCGTAQALAARQAFEASTAPPPSPAHPDSRRLALLAETVSEHALALARDWPERMGESADLALARALRTALAALKHGPRAAAPPRRSDFAAALDTARRAWNTLLGGDADALTADPDRFQTWVRTGATAPARLIGRVSAEGLAGFGRCPFQPMPEAGPAGLERRLEADRDGAYLAQPDENGIVHETGPLVRQWDHPLVRNLTADHGNGLLPRLAARVVEATRGLQDMATLVQTLALEPPPPLPDQGCGLATVQAARGLLAHRVEWRNGRVTRYQILAPTEWNFHPMGPLARGLAAADWPADRDAGWATRLLVTALDPCVACRVTVEGAHA